MLLHQVLEEEPRPPRRLNDAIPRDLDTICLKAMAKEPPRRYATAAELAPTCTRTSPASPSGPGPAHVGSRRSAGPCTGPASALVAATVVSVLGLVGSWLHHAVRERSTPWPTPGARARTRPAVPRQARRCGGTFTTWRSARRTRLGSAVQPEPTRTLLESSGPGPERTTRTSWSSEWAWIFGGSPTTTSSSAVTPAVRLAVFSPTAGPSPRPTPISTRSALGHDRLEQHART